MGGSWSGHGLGAGSAARDVAQRERQREWEQALEQVLERERRGSNRRVLGTRPPGLGRLFVREEQRQVFAVSFLWWVEVHCQARVAVGVAVGAAVGGHAAAGEELEWDRLAASWATM